MSMDYLILVNNTHKIPADYIHGLDLITMHGYDNEVYSVEKNTAAQFCELQKASAQKGIEILLTSAYRSVERQQEIKDEMLEEYGEDYVRQFVAVPGYSEHHTGLALDFVAKIDNQWLIGKGRNHGLSGGALAYPLCRRSYNCVRNNGTGNHAGRISGKINISGVLEDSREFPDPGSSSVTQFGG